MMIDGLNHTKLMCLFVLDRWLGALLDDIFGDNDFADIGHAW